MDGRGGRAILCGIRGANRSAEPGRARNTGTRQIRCRGLQAAVPWWQHDDDRRGDDREPVADPQTAAARAARLHGRARLRAAHIASPYRIVLPGQVAHVARTQRAVHAAPGSPGRAAFSYLGRSHLGA
jgi:hypothetical protein